jgi:hypothetical protein
LKLLLENWREYLNENTPSSGATVGEFLATWQKTSPKSAKKIFGKMAKVLVGLSAGLAVGAGAAAATGGLAAASAPVAGAAAGAAAGKVAEQGVSMLFDYIAGEGGDKMAKFLALMADQQVPDDQRTGLSIFYDLDDNFEELLQGMDSKLANKYQKHLYAYFKTAFDKMDDPSIVNQPLSDYLKMTANQYLKLFLKKKNKSGVGVRVASASSTSGR